MYETKPLFVDNTISEIVSDATAVFQRLNELALEDKVETLNLLRAELHKYSPFSSEPVDFVRWVSSEVVTANDYNPNSVAPPEMKLLEHSIREDGYTQPIVTWHRDGIYEVVDGFHRHRVGKESKIVHKRINGYLPLVVINDQRQDRSDRMASTIRHNRARGKHKVEGMSDIVIELKRRNWTDDRIARELGMDQDEILRLCQITGLADLFSDTEFSRAWDVEGEISESDFTELSDNVETYCEQTLLFRTVNTSDENRVFHTYDNWECYKAGFYNNTKDGMTKEQCEEAYRNFLADIPRFRAALECVISEWVHSCEHYLTNVAMNRIAWLGQAACCYAEGIPSAFRSGFGLLTTQQQREANSVALEYLNKWLTTHGRPEVTMDEALSSGRQSDIY